jgi:hypothetical protein
MGMLESTKISDSTAFVSGLDLGQIVVVEQELQSRAHGKENR